MRKDIVDIELFNSLIEFEIDGQQIDLHNEFDCKQIIYQESEESLIFLFEKAAHGINIKMIFSRVEKLKFDITFKDIIKGINIDLLYRGRYEMEDGLTDAHKGKGYIC